MTETPCRDGSMVLLTDVEFAGTIHYAYVMEFRGQDGIMLFYVTAEENDLATVIGGGSHYLCSYLGGKHRNHGASNDWADVMKFADRAHELYHEEFG